MPIEPERLKKLIDDELKNVGDARVVDHVRNFLVEPKTSLRDWDYGTPDEKYLCWIVLVGGSDTAIAYCEDGFGPRCPWGLVSASGGNRRNSMGMDSGWFPTFMDAYFESGVAVDLPIWRVFSLDDSWEIAQPLTEELPWAEAWDRCYNARQSDPNSRFTVHHSIGLSSSAS